MTNKSKQSNIIEAVATLTALITKIIDNSQDNNGQIKASKIIKKLNKLQDQMVEIVGGVVPKKQKKLVDPEAPKRPMSAYIIFSKEQRPRIKGENPDAKPAELMSIIGKEWKSLSEKKKLPYQKQSEKLKALYTEEKKDYRPKSPEDIKALVEAEKEKKKASRKVEGVAGAKNAWIFFQTDRRAELKGTVESSEMMAQLAKEWKKIKDTKKGEKYKKMADLDKARFEREKVAKIGSPKKSTVKVTVEEESDDMDVDEDTHAGVRFYGEIPKNCTKKQLREIMLQGLKNMQAGNHSMNVETNLDEWFAGGVFEHIVSGDEYEKFRARLVKDMMSSFEHEE